MGFTSLGGSEPLVVPAAGLDLAVAAALHLFLVFPARSPVLTRLSTIGPRVLRRVGGATVPLLYVLPLTLVFVSVAGLAPAPQVADTISHVLLVVRARARLGATSPPDAAGPRAAPLDPLGGRDRDRPGPAPGDPPGDERRRRRRPALPAGRPPHALVPVSVGFAVLRYRLFDVDRVIGRTLVYGALTVAVAGLLRGHRRLLGDVRWRGRPSGRRAGRDGGGRSRVQPLRERLQRRVDRLLYGQRDKPYAAVVRLGEEVRGRGRAGSGLAERGADRAGCAPKLPYAEIALRRGGLLVPVAAAGRRRRLPCDCRSSPGRTVASSRLPPRQGEAGAPAERRLLADLARQA